MAVQMLLKERLKIEELIEQGYSIPEIANEIGRSSNTIYREIKNGNHGDISIEEGAVKFYNPHIAHQRMLDAKKHAKEVRASRLKGGIIEIFRLVEDENMSIGSAYDRVKAEGIHKLPTKKTVYNKNEKFKKMMDKESANDWEKSHFNKLLSSHADAVQRFNQVEFGIDDETLTVANKLEWIIEYYNNYHEAIFYRILDGREDLRTLLGWDDECFIISLVIVHYLEQLWNMNMIGEKMKDKFLGDAEILAVLSAWVIVKAIYHVDRSILENEYVFDFREITFMPQWGMYYCLDEMIDSQHLWSQIKGFFFALTLDDDDNKQYSFVLNTLEGLICYNFTHKNTLEETINQKNMTKPMYLFFHKAFEMVFASLYNHEMKRGKEKSYTKFNGKGYAPAVFALHQDVKKEFFEKPKKSL